MRSMVGRRIALWVTVAIGTIMLAVAIGAPPEHCPSVSADDLLDSSTETVNWFVRNQEADGRWLYEYHREGGPVDTNYNIVRHAGVMSGLYQAANVGIDGALESADAGLAWAEERLVPAGEGTAMSDSRTAKAGTSALLLSALIERRETTGETDHDALIRGLGRFLVGQVEPSGAVLGNYDLEKNRPVPDSYSRYYTGEVYWALGRLHNLFPDEAWGEPANLVGDYVAARRDDAEGIFPPLADHWAGYGLAETVRFPDRPDGEPLTEAEVAYAERQAGLFGAQVRFLCQRYGPWGAAVRPAIDPRGGGYGVMGEGLSGLWHTARADERVNDMAAPIADRAVCNVALAIEAQSDAADAARYDEPKKVQGAWFRDDITRMDDMQHALSALLRAIPIVEENDLAEGDGAVDLAPSIWLWLPILVLAWSPARTALGMPRENRARDELLRLAATGAAIGVAALLVLASLGVWFLDVINVSDSSWRIAAGSVGIIGGIADLFRPAPSPDPALPGRRAALVPIAIPFVVRPALIVLSVGAIADHGHWLTIVGLSVALALFVVAAPAIARDGVSGRVARWVARLSGILLIAGSVLLIINGVLDI